MMVVPARLRLAAAVLLAACPVTQGKERAQVPPANEGFPRTIVDRDGERVIAHRPERILSLSLGTDEILCALAGPDRIVALSRHAGEPEVSNVAGIALRIGVFVSPNAERIVALRPDLVLAARYTKPELRQLAEQAGAPTVLVTDFARISDVEANIQRIAHAIGEEARAAQLIPAMRARLAAARNRLRPSRRALRVLYLAPGHWTSGEETNLHEIITKTGLRNAAAERGLRGFLRISAEEILKLDPDVILTATGYARDRGFRERLTGDAQLAPLSAIKRRRLIELPSRYVLTVSQHIADAVEALVLAVNALPD